MEARDSNGTLLNEGDNVTLIKDLKLRGSSAVIKRGTLVKGIRLTDDAGEVEGRIERQTIVLRTEFLKKA
ncbi:MAG: alkylphosphonate utilization protein [Bacteroidia bacterium]|jgi:protein PhnA|nr:alkylphosphonate utilization protein [Bacteroidia bacterium]